MSRSIPLSQNQWAVVDDEDFARLNSFRWCYRAERNGNQDYAVRHAKVDGKDRTVYMHRDILTAPLGHEVIFLNYDRLDCRRANLKAVTKQEARQHHRVRSDSETGLKGVRLDREGRTWSVYIHREGHCYNIGTFDSQEEAAEAYETVLRRENPDLHLAPSTVDRSGFLREDEDDNPDLADG